jgi:hypothetical protein
MDRCLACDRLILPGMRAVDVAAGRVHDRDACREGRTPLPVAQAAPVVSDATRAVRWADAHLGKPALALTRREDSFTHRAYDRRPETPANPAPVRRGKETHVTRDQEAREILRLERERALLEHPSCPATPETRDPHWPAAHCLIRDLERGEAMFRLTNGDAYVQARKVAMLAAYHDKSGALVAVRAACRDGRREVVFASDGEMIREDTPPMQAKCATRIAKAGAWTRTVYARAPDWTGDDLKGDGFRHLATHILTTGDV